MAKLNSSGAGELTDRQLRRRSRRRFSSLTDLTVKRSSSRRRNSISNDDIHHLKRSFRGQEEGRRPAGSLQRSFRGQEEGGRPSGYFQSSLRGQEEKGRPPASSQRSLRGQEEGLRPPASFQPVAFGGSSNKKFSQYTGTSPKEKIEYVHTYHTSSPT